MSDASHRQIRFHKPPGATEVFLVRHGESEPAVDGKPFPLVDGHGDPALAPEGLVHADQVGERLADEGIDAVYVTTLRRTAQTAAPLLARIGLEARVEADLREVSLGEWDGGQYRKHARAGHPLIIQMMQEERWDVIPGAEPMEVFAERVAAGLARIVAAHADQRVAVFTHGGVIGEAMRLAVGGTRPFAFIGADNGSISHLVAIGDRWIVRRYNDTAHLAPGYDRE